MHIHTKLNHLVIEVEYAVETAQKGIAEQKHFHLANRNWERHDAKYAGVFELTVQVLTVEQVSTRHQYKFYVFYNDS